MDPYHTCFRFFNSKYIYIGINLLFNLIFGFNMFSVLFFYFSTNLFILRKKDIRNGKK